jgi:cytoskeletal protein CcmA (bactofilin family)
MSNAERSREQVRPEAGPQPVQPPDERRTAAWVGKALLIQGKIISTENLTIDGSVEGTIELGEHSLTIGAGASIKADLIARTIVISGAVAGNVRASVKVDLKATGSVNGDVVAPLLVMADGAVITRGVNATGRKPSST